MAPEQSQLPIVEPVSRQRCCNLAYVGMGLGLGVVLTLMLGVAYYAGKQSGAGEQNQIGWNGIPANRIPPEFLSATASHGGTNMAVCTAPIDENAEGFFVLDYLTGNLMGWVYYPRQMQFGGQFMTNVIPQLGMSKNPEYLLVSGGVAPVSVGGNMKAAASLIYVVDMRSGYFAAYTIPWNRASENSSVPQGGQISFIGGGQIREPWGAGKKPAAPPAAGGAAAGGAAPGAPKKDPNNPDANMDPNDKPAAVPPQPGNKQNPNNGKGKK